MKKKGKKRLKKDILIYGGVLLLLVIIVLSVRVYLKKQGENYVNLSNLEGNITNNEVYINDQFSNSLELHWTHMPLTYSINFSEYSPEIRKTKELRVKYALERIHNAIPEIDFIRVESENADILILGEISVQMRIENSPQDCPENYDCNTEALAIPNYTGRIIHNGLVYFTEALRLDNPNPSSDTEVHEIFHLFGISHSDSVGGIMSAMISSLSSVDIGENIISCLRKIYSNGQFLGNCSNVNMYKDCGEGYVFGQDNKCHEECGKGYCSEGSVCKDGECYGCGVGYTLDVESWSCTFLGCPFGYYLYNNSCLPIPKFDPSWYYP